MAAGSPESAIDDPNRITKSKAAGALFCLTPRKYQSGEKDITSGITRVGDEMVRTALYEAAKYERRQAAGVKTSQGRPGVQDRCDSASHVARWLNLPVD